MENNFHVGWCPFCNQGWINIYKDSGNDKFLLLCDECDTIWDDPKFGTNNSIKYNLVETLKIPSMKELQEIEWDKFLIQSP